MDHRAGVWFVRRSVADTAFEGRAVDRLPLRRVFPPTAAAGAVVPVVFRTAGVAATRGGPMAEAAAQRAVLDCGDRRWPVHVGARRRAAWRRHRLATARPEAGRDCARADHGADLSLCAA